MIKHFSCFKVDKKEKESQPDYRLSAKVGDKFVEVGGGWIKQGEHTKYISFKLSDAYKEKSGFVIMEEKGTVPQTKEEEIIIAGSKLNVWPEKEEDIDPDKIPF